MEPSPDEAERVVEEVLAPADTVAAAGAVAGEVAAIAITAMGTVPPERTGLGVDIEKAERTEDPLEVPAEAIGPAEQTRPYQRFVGDLIRRHHTEGQLQPVMQGSGTAETCFAVGQRADVVLWGGPGASTPCHGGLLQSTPHCFSGSLAASTLRRFAESLTGATRQVGSATRSPIHGKRNRPTCQQKEMPTRGRDHQEGIGVRGPGSCQVESKVATATEATGMGGPTCKSVVHRKRSFVFR